MMMALDQFVFSLQTAPYRELQRRRSWKHRRTSRVGARDASQYTGVGDDTITLTGALAPAEGFGRITAMKDLSDMGDQGEAYVLVDALGQVYGAYVIEGLDETQRYHTALGVPRNVEFTLTLSRVEDSALQMQASNERAVNR